MRFPGKMVLKLFLLSAKPDSLQLLLHFEHFRGRWAVKVSNLVILGEVGHQLRAVLQKQFIFSELNENKNKY